MHKAFLNEQLLGKFGTLIFLMYAKKEYWPKFSSPNDKIWIPNTKTKLSYTATTY
jgi:hypothetical protein